MSIEARNIYSGYYIGLDILQGVSLRVRASKITAIIGPNGCGKSTLLKTMYGFLKPTQGSVWFKNEDVTGSPPHKMLDRGIVYLPQVRNTFPYLSVYDNLKITCWSFRKDKALVDQTIKRIYDIFPKLKAREKVFAGSLSGGEQKMLEFAKVYMHKPSTIIVDEPTAGLAPQIAQKVYGFIKELGKRELTILIVDQNVRQAVMLSDYVYVMESGIIKDHGPKKKFADEMEKVVKSWI